MVDMDVVCGMNSMDNQPNQSPAKMEHTIDAPFTGLESKLVSIDDLLHNAMSDLGNLVTSYNSKIQKCHHDALYLELETLRRELEKRDRTLSEMNEQLTSATSEVEKLRSNIHTKERLNSVYLGDLNRERMKTAELTKKLEENVQHKVI